MTKTDQAKSMNLNNIATLGAVILSVVAILISVLEVSTMRTQQKASVWPYLQIKALYNAEGFQIFLQNKGIGPALVKDVKLFVDEEEIQGIEEAIVNLVGPENAFSYETYRASNPSNSVMSADEDLLLFSVPLKVNKEGRLENFEPGIMFAEQANTRFDISICYCSIFDDCWLTKVRQTSVQEVKSCAYKH